MLFEVLFSPSESGSHLVYLSSNKEDLVEIILNLDQRFRIRCR